MNNYNKALEFFMENNIVLNEGLINNLKKKIDDRNKKNKENHDKYVKSLYGNDLSTSKDKPKKKEEDVVVKWYKKPYYLDDTGGEFRKVISTLKTIGIPESDIVNRIANSDAFTDDNIIETMGAEEGQYDKRIISVLDQGKYGWMISGNDDDIEFMSPINKKIYAFFTDGSFKQISLYKFFGGDSGDIDKDEIEWYKEELGLE